MNYNAKRFASMALGMGLAALLVSGVSMADEGGSSRAKNRGAASTTVAGGVPVVPSAPVAVPQVPAVAAPPAPVSQPSVVYNFYFGTPAIAGAAPSPAAVAPVPAPAAAPAPAVGALPSPVAAAAPARTQYDTYCASCHGNSYKNSSVSKTQEGNKESSSMRAAVGSLSTAILSAIAAGQ